jgi:tRNA A-37 threonylcarbamoyl transferase component Bud32
LEKKDIGKIAEELGLEPKIVYEELLEVVEQMRKKGDKRHFLFDESKFAYIFDHNDLKFLNEGYRKLGFMDLAVHFDVDVKALNKILNQLMEKGAIEESVVRYYFEVKNKPSVKAWFEPAEVMTGEETTLNIEVHSPSEISEPKLIIAEPTSIQLEYEPRLSSRISQGKLLEKYKYKTIKHGNYKVDVKLEGIIEGVKFGPEKLDAASLRIKPLPPEIYIDVRLKKVSATYLRDCTISLIFYNKGKGEAQNLEIKGFEKYQEFDVLGSTKIGNIAAHGKIEHPLIIKPKKSGNYSFENLVFTYEDLDGKPLETAIPSIEVDVETPQPKVKTEIIAPPIARSNQIFSITTKISNIGEGEARNLSFKLPIDERFVLSGYVACFIPKLGTKETEEFIISLQAPEKGQIRIDDFDLQLQDVEGTPMTHECNGVVIPIREVAGPDIKETIEWPFSPDNVVGEKFYIIKEVGEGAFARVYLTKDNMLKKERALKTLKPDFVTDSSFVDEFIEEAKISIELQTPNIVRVFDVGKETYHGKIYPYIVMEYMKGGTLEDRLLPGKPMSFFDCIKVMQDICSALTYAHQREVIHCDVKPSNIFYDSEKDTWKLGDFGLAKITQKGEVSSRSGTFMYMAPEVKEGKTSKKSDIYSLGAVFREMLTGDPRGDVSRLDKTSKRANREILQKLSNVIEKMTSANPAERPSLKEVWEIVKWSSSTWGES